VIYDNTVAGSSAVNASFHDLLKNSSIDRLIEYLVHHDELGDQVRAEPELEQSLLARVRHALHKAYTERDSETMRVVQLALYYLYSLNRALPVHSEIRNQYDPTLIGIRNSIEDAWIGYELSQIEITPGNIPESPKEFISYFKARYATNASAQRFYGYLERDASAAGIADFFASDCPLNMLFFDLVAMSLIGLEGGRRSELVRNLWDESGHGVDEKSHTMLFRRVMAYSGRPCDPDRAVEDLSWEGLAGYNLYLFLGLHRRNFYRSLGNMAMTELMDPELYTKLLHGCERVGLTDREQLAYYAEHITQDVEHGDGWLQNVIVPTIVEDPKRTYDIVIGAELRSRSSAAYYDYLHRTLKARHG
jgi:hypothetical protein